MADSIPIKTQQDLADTIKAGVMDMVEAPLPPEPKRPMTGREVLAEARISIFDELDQEFECITIIKDGLSAVYGTLGNISVSKGKAKSRKSFFAAMLAAAAIRNGLFQGTIKCDFPKDKTRIVIFDTEQGKNRAKKLVRRIYALLRGALPKEEFDKIVDVYSLRKYSPQDRINAINDYLQDNNDAGLAIIDGIRDLTFDINDSKTAVQTVQLLMEWSEVHQVHIHTIIHQNKNDNHAKGHLGSELIAKAETVADITLDRNYGYSSVVADLCREMNFQDLYFRIDENGLPEFCDAEREEVSKTTNPVELADKLHGEVLTAVFRDTDSISYTNLIMAVKSALFNIGVKVGTNKAKDFVAYYSNNKMIVTVESPRGKGNSTFYGLAND